jgi:hypothetical protein
MAEVKTYVFNHKEVTEALIKHQNIHEGFWQIYVEFGIAAAIVATGPDQFSPAAIVPVSKIGILRMEQEAPLTVDATKVNPE